STGNDACYGVSQGISGGFAVAGRYGTATDLGNSHPITPGGIFLAIYNSSGVCQQARSLNFQIGGAQSPDQGWSVATDFVNNRYLFVGQATSRIVLDRLVAANVGSQDVFIVAYNARSHLINV